MSPVEPITVPRFLGGWWIPDATIAALRIGLALLIVAHGLQEHFGILLPRGQTWLGAPVALSDRWLAATVEIAGGTLLALGAFTRWASLALAVVVALSQFAPLNARGHWTFIGPEYIAVLSAVLVTFAIIGPGFFSVDALREGRRGPRKSGSTVDLSPWIKKQYRRRELTR
jgi:putative oxidoreductase